MIKHNSSVSEISARTALYIQKTFRLRSFDPWRSHFVPHAAIKLVRRSVNRVDRMEDSGKSKGGGLCFYIHNNWCTDTTETHSSVDLEFLTLRY